MGNANFAFSLQQLVSLPLLWSLSDHLNVTNATTPWPQAVPVRVFNDSAMLVGPSYLLLPLFHFISFASVSFHVIFFRFISFHISFVIETRTMRTWCVVHCEDLGILQFAEGGSRAEGHTHAQANTSLTPLSWGQYVSAIIEYYNTTGAHFSQDLV